jgi:hypothetical protein
MNINKSCKLKYYEIPINNFEINRPNITDRISNITTPAIATSSKKTNLSDNNNFSEKLLNRQFSYLLNGSDIENYLKIPNNSAPPNICNTYNEPNNFNQSELLINNNDYSNLLIKYNIKCNEYKKDINWGDYYLSLGQKTNGRGIGNPNNYYKTYIGIDTRSDPNIDNIRCLDMQDKYTIPLDSFRINYGALDYSNNTRNGISTTRERRAQAAQSRGLTERKAPGSRAQ